MRVAAYIRVSDESQIEGYSLEAQRTEIGRWCDRRGHELVAVYSEEGVSAHSDRIERRPELMRLLKDGVRLFDLVVVHTLDRWARNVGVQRQALQRLGDAKVGFASVSEDIDFSTPSGRLMLTMIGGVAEFFSDQLAVHVRKGLQERARQGLHNGDIPFGYRRCQEDFGCPANGHPGGVHIVADEALALQELFRLYSTGALTQTDAATSLNVQGFRSRNKRDSGRGNGPQPFTNWSIRDIISNPFYMGVVRWNRTEIFPGQHEPIIDIDLFWACQSVKTAHRSRSKTFSPSTRAYLLKGILRCASCGEAFWAERGGRQQRPYYRGARRGQECGCCSKSFKTEVVDARVGLLVYALTLPSDWLARASKPRCGEWAENEGA